MVEYIHNQIKHMTQITKTIEVSPIPTQKVWDERDRLIQEGFKHVNNIKKGRWSDAYTMIFVKNV